MKNSPNGAHAHSLKSNFSSPMQFITKSASTAPSVTAPPSKLPCASPPTIAHGNAASSTSSRMQVISLANRNSNPGMSHRSRHLQRRIPPTRRRTPPRLPGYLARQTAQTRHLGRRKPPRRLHRLRPTRSSPPQTQNLQRLRNPQQPNQTPHSLRRPLSR